jgi:putative transcription factor
MNCEMCGMETKSLKKILVEGTVLSVCPRCAKYGKEITPATSQSAIPVPFRKTAVPKETDIYEKMPDEELVDDYNERIRKAREARGWSQEELGKRINEKRSIIAKIETKEFRPPDALVKKLESTLNIKLMEKVEENVTLKNRSTHGTLTLGDMIVIKEEKKKK